MRLGDRLDLGREAAGRHLGAPFFVEGEGVNHSSKVKKKSRLLGANGCLEHEKGH